MHSQYVGEGVSPRIGDGSPSFGHSLETGHAFSSGMSSAYVQDAASAGRFARDEDSATSAGSESTITQRSSSVSTAESPGLYSRESERQRQRAREREMCRMGVLISLNCKIV